MVLVEERIHQNLGILVLYRRIMSLLEIKSDKPKSFNDYLMKKIKADLKQSALSFNPTFLFRSKQYSVRRCIESLYCRKGVITFKEIIPIKYLIYNNRHLYWLKFIAYYKNNLNKEYLLYVGKLANRKTISRKLV